MEETENYTYSQSSISGNARRAKMGRIKSIDIQTTVFITATAGTNLLPFCEEVIEYIKLFSNDYILRTAFFMEFNGRIVRIEDGDHANSLQNKYWDLLGRVR